MSNFHGLGPCKGRRSTTCIEESVCAKILRSHTVTLFFPRVRTPCGHGAQVIIEGREKPSDGGEKGQRQPNKQKATANHSPQAESPPSCSLSSVLGKTR